MKKIYLFATALAALVSCSSDDFVGENSPNTTQGTNAISFSYNMPATTRATQDHTTSAATLNNQFVVWGEKSSSAETGSAGTPVFINYVVNYGASTARTSESNSHDWEYVNQTPYAGSKVTSTGSVATVSDQTIKYWDFTNKYYTFTAFSAKPSDISGDKIIVSKTVAGSTVYEKGYTMQVKAGASIDDIYFADREVVEAGSSTNTLPVTLDFRRLVSRVRFGFYETIPGYSVAITDVKFNSASHTSDGAGNFGVNGSIVIPGTTTSFTVTYDDGSVITANANKAKVTVTTPSTQGYLSTTATSFFGTTLGTTSSTRTWENGGNYTTILPNPSNTTDLTLTISYTLTSTDNSGETIAITDATAKVPAAYAQWQSNYAYTYLFKISDNTNGSSGQSITGLYPITLDAVVVEDEAGNQETITTVAPTSITTYQKGAIANEYNAGTIYVVGGDGSTNLTSSNAKLYTATIEAGAAQGITGDGKVAITEEMVANALTKSPDGSGNYVLTDAKGKKLTVTPSNLLTVEQSSIPASDSPSGEELTVKCAKFTAVTNTVYVFEYIVSTEKYYKVIKVGTPTPISGS